MEAVPNWMWVLVAIGIVAGLVRFAREIFEALEIAAEACLRFFASVLQLIMEHVLRLKAWGDSLYTESVEGTLQQWTALSILQFGLDLLAWTTAFILAFHSLGNKGIVLAIMTACIPASAILLFDRGVYVANSRALHPGGMNKMYGQIGTRLGITIALSLVTAVPFELLVLHSEIKHQRDQTMKVETDQIRASAEQREHDRFDAQAAAIRTTADHDLTTRTEETRANREQIVARHTAAHDDFERRIALQQQAAINENNRPGREHGTGPRYTSLSADREAIERAQARQSAHDAQELRTFDRDTRVELAAITTSRDQALAHNQSELEAKLTEVRTMPAERLAAIYGGHFQQAEGFLADYRVLEDLRKHDDVVNLIVWGLRFVMISIGLLIVINKLASNFEVKQYFDVGAQAKAGNVDAIRMLRNVGYNDADKYALDDVTRTRLNEYRNACIAFARSMEAFWLEVRRVAVEHADGQCLPLHTVRYELHKYFVEHNEEKLNDLRKKAGKLIDDGIGCPAWPAELNDGVDPLAANNPSWQPWNIEEMVLQNRGWVDPQPAIERVHQAQDSLRRNYLRLKSAITTVEDRTEREIKGSMIEDPDKLARHISRIRGDIWESRFQAVLEQMASLEHELAFMGAKVLPPWPADFPDPRHGLKQRICTFTRDDLERVSARIAAEAAASPRPARTNGNDPN